MASFNPLSSTDLQVVNGFLAKADGKDKLTALVQYACMFLSAGEPGNIKKIQASVTAARKVFRIMRPLESLTPVILAPGFSGKQPPSIEALNQAKAVLMAMYFAADHCVWAHQIGLTSNKQLADKFQKLSLYSWALGSVCTILVESWQAYKITFKDLPNVSPEDQAKKEQLELALKQRLFVATHGLVQAALAAGLLQLVPWKPRTVGFLGVVASAMNCYLLLPPRPQQSASAKPFKSA